MSTETSSPQSMSDTLQTSSSEPVERRPATLKTIAKRSGLSVTAVSRALRDGDDIGADTKARVRAIAQELGYRPSRAGVRLRTGKTQVISLILNIDEEIMGISSQMINGISERLRDTAYHLVVTPYSHGDDPMDPLRYVVETHSADGVIFSRTQLQDPRIPYLIQNKMPFATHGRTSMGIQHAWHDFDNERFVRDGVARLKAHGAKRIGLLAPPAHLSFTQHMQTGFLKALAHNNVEPSVLDGVTIDDKLDTIERYIADIMHQPNHPDGIVCGAGSAAMAATAGIEQAGLMVGRDVHIISKQSTHILKRYRQAIHVIHEDVKGAGYDLADLVLKAIDGTQPAALQHLSYPEGR